MHKLEISLKLAKTFKLQYKEVTVGLKAKELDIKLVRWYFEYNIKHRHYISTNTLFGRTNPNKNVSVVEQKESQFKQNCTLNLVAQIGRKKVYSYTKFENIPVEIINVHKQKWIDDQQNIVKNQNLHEIFGKNVPLNIIELQYISPSLANKYKLSAIEDLLVLYDPHNGLCDINGFLKYNILGVYNQIKNSKELFILAYDDYNGKDKPYTFIKTESDYILYSQGITKSAVVKNFNSVEAGENFNITKYIECYKLKNEEYQSMFKNKVYSTIS